MHSRLYIFLPAAAAIAPVTTVATVAALLFRSLIGRLSAAAITLCHRID